MVYHSLITTAFWHTSPFMKPFVTVPSSFSNSTSYVITKSRNHGAVVASMSRSRSSGAVSFKGFSSQNSISSIFSFQEFIPLNVSDLIVFTLIHTVLFSKQFKTCLQDFAKIVSTCTKLRYNCFYFSVLTLFSFQR